MFSRATNIHLKSAITRFIVILGIAFATGLATAAMAAAENLPDDLKGFTIRDSFVPLNAKPIGTIRALRGKLVVRHGRTFKAY